MLYLNDAFNQINFWDLGYKYNYDILLTNPDYFASF